MKSKYGNARGTQYGSSRTNLPSSASKNRGISNVAEPGKPHKAPVQVDKYGFHCFISLNC